MSALKKNESRAMMAFGVFILISVASSMPINDNQEETIAKFKLDPWAPGKYQFEFETSFGSARKEKGYITTRDDGRKVFITEGFYSYIDPDGKRHRVDYFADEFGYHPVINKDSILKDTGDLQDEIESIFDFSDSKNEKTPEQDEIEGAEKSKLDNRFPPEVIASLLG